MPHIIWAIPGFLGLPSDWDHLRMPNVRGVDLYTFDWKNLSHWATQFNQLISKKTDTTNILMGYSLGGRLALHALIDQPRLWKGAIIISAHPGLSNIKERKHRDERDENWAQRFKVEDWQKLMYDWNAQEVFAHDSFRFERQECHYQRKDLVHTLIHGSLAHQLDLKEQIAAIDIPILWITGEKDDRYCELGRSLEFFSPLSSLKVISESGHRVPWDRPLVFTELVESFLQQIHF